MYNAFFREEYTTKAVAALDRRSIDADVISLELACGSIVANLTILARLRDVASIDARGATPEFAGLNHQQILQRILLETWEEGIVSGEVNVSARNVTFEEFIDTYIPLVCRTSCAGRDCGVMDDLCGGTITCGTGTCRELEVCTNYGMCEANVNILLERDSLTPLR